MSDKVSLLFGVHAHQPAGNFERVVNEAHERCYGPFLRTVADYPDFRFAAHFSGPLLDQLAARYPEDMRLLGAMVARGQAELFGAGDTEPVLAAIPHRDRLGQIRRLSSKLESRFGQRPQGAWLTERVWESAVVPALAESGIRYVTVDDYHFLATGRTASELDGFYTTEEDGRTLDVFPISEELRYRLPFAPAAEAVSYIESLVAPGRASAAVYFDDIEKFGVWPETFAWVYERGWLREFIERVLASPRIEASTYAGFHANQRTRGIVYLPTTSYIEMNEWSLPAEAADRYAALVRAERDAGRFAAVKGFLRGGIWRNFLSRYPEANWMHKRMLGLSTRLDALPAGDANEPLRDLLYLAQANDAYWHGLFGGLYLPHLRRGVYRHLLALERALDRCAPRPVSERADPDHDGIDDLFFRSAELQAVIRLDGSAAVRELSSYALMQNFGDTLRRHREHYHDRAKKGIAESAAAKGEGIASAHDRIAFKHAIGPEDLMPDPQPRDMFRDQWRRAGEDGHPIDRYWLASHEAAVPRATFRATIGDTTVTKSAAVDDRTCRVRYALHTESGGELRSTLDIAMPSCDGYAGRYIVDGHIPGGFGQPLALTGSRGLVLDDRFMQGSVTLSMSRPATVDAQPYHTVSQSEDGFERVMQSATITCSWVLPPGEHVIEVSLEVIPDPHPPGH